MQKKTFHKIQPPRIIKPLNKLRREIYSARCRAAIKTLQLTSCCCCLVLKSCLFCDPVDYSQPGSSAHGTSRQEHHFLLQWTFPTQQWNPHVLHWRVDSLPLSHLGSPTNKIKDLKKKKTS